MSGKLLKYQLKSMTRFLGVLVAGYLVLLGVYALLSLFQSPFVSAASGFLMVLTIILLTIIMVMQAVGLWQEVIHSFFDKRAHLIRTLTISRSEIYWTIIVNLLIQLVIFSLLALLLVVVVRSCDRIGWTDTFALLIEQEPDLMIWFVLTIPMQALSYLICGLLGIYFGYKMNSSKMGWSLLFGFLFAYGVQAIMVIILFVIMTAQGIAVFDQSLVPGMDLIRQILMTCFFMYLVVNTAGIIIGWKLYSGKADVDG